MRLGSYWIFFIIQILPSRSDSLFNWAVFLETDHAIRSVRCLEGITKSKVLRLERLIIKKSDHPKIVDRLEKRVYSEIIQRVRQEVWIGIFFYWSFLYYGAILPLLLHMKTPYLYLYFSGDQCFLFGDCSSVALCWREDIRKSVFKTWYDKMVKMKKWWNGKMTKII